MTRRRAGHQEQSLPPLLIGYLAPKRGPQLTGCVFLARLSTWLYHLRASGSAQSHSVPSERWRSQEISGPLGLTFQPLTQDPQVQVVRGDQEISVDLLSGESA